MEVNYSNNYKKTNIGYIPVEWNFIRIEKLSILITDGAHFSPASVNNGFPIATVENMHNGSIDLAECRIISKTDYSYLVKNNCKPKKGDVLLSKDGTIGLTATIVKNEDYVLLSSIAIIRPNPNLLLSKYLDYNLQSTWFYKFLRKVKGGSAIKRIVLRDINKLPIPLPPTLTEQKAIATALTDIDNLINNLEQQIQKKKAIKKGAMQQLLTPPHKGGKRLPGFEGEWVEKTIESLCVSKGLIRGPFGGALKKEYFVLNGYKVYEQKNAIKQSVTIGRYFINEDKFKELKRFELQKHDFILSCSGTIGRLYQIPYNFQKGIINQALLIIRIDSNVSEFKYFEHQFKSDKIQRGVIDDTQGGAMKNLIGMSDFRKALIPYPPTLKEQRAISTILSDIDKDIKQHQAKKAKYQAIKQGMMQELLTGKTRLV